VSLRGAGMQICGWISLLGIPPGVVMVMEHESIPMGIEGLIQEWASEVV